MTPSDNTARPPSTSDPRRGFGEAAPAWKTWDPQLVSMTHAATGAILAAAQVGPGMRVLDVAGGTGEPGLALAQQVGPTGQVTITDVSGAMLSTARDKATQQGLSNIRIEEANAEQLPYPDASFDRVTCRFGAMFFANLPQALAEIRRVLIPAGRATFTVWGPLERNPFFLTGRAIFSKHVQLPPPPPDAPELAGFRLAEPGTVTTALTAAGFTHVREETRVLPWPFPGSPETFWQFMQAVGRPVMCPGIDLLQADVVEQVRGEVLSALRQYEQGGQLQFTADVIVALAIR